MCRFSKQLGEQLAELHCHNRRQLDRLSKEQQTVGTVNNQYDQYSLTGQKRCSHGFM